MKTLRSFTSMALVALVLAGPAESASWRAIEHVPNAAAVTVLVRDRERVYFRVTPASPLTVPVSGPEQLRVISRVELPAGAHGVSTYVLRALDGQRVLETLDTESAAAAEVHPSTGSGALGKSRKMTFDVPRGTRHVTLALSGAASVLVRLQEGGAVRPVTPMVSLTPLTASRSVSVTEGEKTIPYYTVLAGRPVKVRIVGPTTLELLTRLDYDATMRGAQTYRLRLSEGDRTLRDLQVKTTKASTASYANLADRVPSKFTRFALAIGAGVHEIGITLLEPSRATVEIHARIPEPSVGNEE